MKRLLLLISLSCLGQCPTSTVWDGLSWSNGTPNVTLNAIINAPYTVNAGQGFACCRLEANATLEIKGNAFVRFQTDAFVNAGGSIIVRSGANFIPADANSHCYGNVTVQRTTTPFGPYGYQYASSPVVGQAIGTAFPSSNWWQSYFFSLDTSSYEDLNTEYTDGTIIYGSPDGQDDNHDSWVQVAPNTVMEAGKGYAVMSAVTGTQSITFNGPVNCGVIQYPITTSVNGMQNWNLVGQPYSASIFWPLFLTENAASIYGTIGFWTHNSAPSASYPGLDYLNFTMEDLAWYNELGGIQATSGGKIPIDYGGTGQGFYVEARQAGFVTFKPPMMADGYINGTNPVFFRTADDPRKRIWLSIKDSQTMFAQTLIGYHPESTASEDDRFDFRQTDAHTPLKIYSIQSERFRISARGNFDESDIVPIGIEAVIAGSYTISRDTINEIAQAYIIDNGEYHELPYSFYTEAGAFDNRFQLVYQPQLSIQQNGRFGATVYPNPAQGIINISGNYSAYSIYDTNGRLILSGNQPVIHIEAFGAGFYYLRTDMGQTIKIIKT